MHNAALTDCDGDKVAWLSKMGEGRAEMRSRLAYERGTGDSAFVEYERRVKSEEGTLSWYGFGLARV